MRTTWLGNRLHRLRRPHHRDRVHRQQRDRTAPPAPVTLGSRSTPAAMEEFPRPFPQLTHVAIGQHAEIHVDTFPGVVVNAMVDSIAPASGAQFSLLPPDNATGNFTKVVQRIPVKLRISPDNPLAGNLRPGMSVIATILTDTTPPHP